MSTSDFGAGGDDGLCYDLPHDFSVQQFNEMLLWAHGRKASDINIASGDYITAQIQGVWRPITKRRLEHAELEFIVTITYNESGVVKLDSGEALNYTMSAVITRDHVISFRANATRSRIGALGRGIQITARAIPGLPPKWEALNIEQEITDAFFPRYGLVLVVGTTGSGKSTLMASSVRRRLENHADPVKIGSFEAPVEYTFGDLGLGHMPLISQVEIGQGADLRTWHQAGPNAMRRKFDVIISGEMSDAESVRSALEMAESGHSVLATLHVDTPAEAVSRVVSFFSEAEQPAVASKLMAALRLVVAQKLSPNTQGTRTAFRSWLSFDRKVKEAMGDLHYSKWQRLLSGITRERGADFPARVFPALKSGLITFQKFVETSGLTLQEARAYAIEGGLDASHLD